MGGAHIAKSRQFEDETGRWGGAALRRSPTDARRGSSGTGKADAPRRRILLGSHLRPKRGGQGKRIVFLLVLEPALETIANLDKPLQLEVTAPKLHVQRATRVDGRFQRCRTPPTCAADLPLAQPVRRKCSQIGNK